MSQSLIRNLTLATLLAYPAFALGADQPPDIKGKWIGKTHTILVGKGGHWPKGRGTWDKPALLEKDLVFDITGQEGRRKEFAAANRPDGWNFWLTYALSPAEAAPARSSPPQRMYVK
jgi:hypothetical protein